MDSPLISWEEDSSPESVVQMTLNRIHEKPTSSIRWYSLAMALSAVTTEDSSVTTLYNTVDCLVRAIEFASSDPLRAVFWEKLAFALGTNGSTVCHGQFVTQRDALTEAVIRRDHMALYWSRLGSVLSEDGEDSDPSSLSIILPSQSSLLSRRHCFHKAITLDENCSEAWKGLGESMKEGDVTNVPGFGPLTREKCFSYGNRKDVRMKLSSKSMHSSSHGNGEKMLQLVHPSVDSLSVRDLTEFIRQQMAERFNESREIQVSPPRCLRLYTTVRNQSDSLLLAVVSPVELMANDEFETISMNSLSDSSVFSIVSSVSGSIPYQVTSVFELGTALLKKEEKEEATLCFLQCLTEKDDCSEVWNNLACGLKTNESVLFNGIQLNQRECLELAVNCDQNNAVAKRNLIKWKGIEVESTVRYAVNTERWIDKTFTVDKSTVEAWRNSNDDATAIATETPTTRTELLETLSDGETVANPEHWFVLGNSLQEDETMLLPSDQLVSAADCYVEALCLNPFDSDSWNNLGALLWRLPWELRVGNQHFSPLDCCQCALVLDPSNDVAMRNVRRLRRVENTSETKEYLVTASTWDSIQLYKKTNVPSSSVKRLH